MSQERSFDDVSRLYIKKMARPKGFEPLTPRFVVWCSDPAELRALCASTRVAETACPYPLMPAKASAEFHPLAKPSGSGLVAVNPAMDLHRRVRQGQGEGGAVRAGARHFQAAAMGLGQFRRNGQAQRGAPAFR